MFYTIQSEHSYDDVLRPFVRNIERYCADSEFQYMTRDALLWEIPCNEHFSFEDFYYIKKCVPVFKRQVWEKASCLSDTDGIFLIPVVINYCGESHYYNIAVPSRIRCLDSQGRILKKNTGRYHMFKSYSPDKPEIYVTERLMNELKVFPDLKFKGAE